MTASPHPAPATVALSTEDLIGAVAGAPAVPSRTTRPGFRHPPRFILAAGFLGLLAVVALGPGLFTGYDPLSGDVLETLQAPSWVHPSAPIVSGATSSPGPSTAPATRC